MLDSRFPSTSFTTNHGEKMAGDLCRYSSNLGPHLCVRLDQQNVDAVLAMRQQNIHLRSAAPPFFLSNDRQELKQGNFLNLSHILE